MKNKTFIKFFAAAVLFALCYTGRAFAADSENVYGNSIENIDFSSLSGGRVTVRVKLKAPMVNPPAGFTLNNPARIALDFPDTANGLAKSNIPTDQGALKSITLAQAKDRTRMVLNLSKNVSYNTSLNGDEVVISLQGIEIGASGTTAETRFAESKAGSAEHAITGVDFARGKNGEGRVIVDLSDANAGINIKQKGKLITIDFINTDVPAELQRRLNVINFNTPVLYVDTMKQGKNGRMVIEPKGDWEQSAYQADKKFILDVRQKVEDPNKLVQGSKPGYAGEKLSLNFQNIEVRSVLQVIADFTGLNIVASDTVTGNITLRLKDVPWDQAMDVIMQNKGLKMRKKGNVITVAPADEVAAKEKAELEALKQQEELEPLRTEMITLRYHKAEAMRNILMGGNARAGAGGAGATAGAANMNRGIISQRGNIGIDARTNTLFIQETAKKLEEIQAIINKTDVPVRQVMIESRLVLADEKFGKSLGARFGVESQTTPGNNTLMVGGNLDATSAVTRTGTGAVTAGTGGLNSNLPVANPAGQIAFSLFRLPAGLLLNLELTALETDNRGKIVSSPRVTTANQQKAKIAQGTEIPYLQASSSGATNVQFKEAVLSLEVTPQITPDEKIIMDLEVKKEKVGQVFFGVPSIDTQKVNTQVLVSNGETAVLGGIYEQTERNDVSKVPFFGDLPVIGNAFKRRTKQDDKTELLIFITPKIMDESIGLR
ncbi:MAG TPA: type IV pilus secretin PilQ [Methylophilus sp.]|nr:type IV pilus secretin PilQ [Methylophilus sp.]HQQ33045.1 type IV pilus secretin PilQ [Methylophilus sp.]